MRRVWHIFVKEFRHYFDSPLAYILVSVFLLITGWLFSSAVFLVNRASINIITSNMPVLLLFFAAALSMQLVAGEVSSGTIELLGTLPVKRGEIVAGKFSAAFAMLSIAVLMTLVLPLSITPWGNFDWGQIAAAYMGMLLIGAVFLSAGLFASSMTSNSIAAFIAGFTISFILFLAGKLVDLLPSSAAVAVNYLGIDMHWENFERGIVDFKDLVYFLSLTGFFLFGAYSGLNRRFMKNIFRPLSLVMLASAVIVVNIISAQTVFRVDMTERNIYSLSAASKKIVRHLDDPVIIKAYFSSNLPPVYSLRKKYLVDLLKEYRIYSGGMIKTVILDPNRDDESAREAMLNGIPPLRFTESDRETFRVQQGYMGLVMLYGDSKEVIPVVENVTDLEYELTTRIKKLTSSGKKKIGYIKRFKMDPGLNTAIRQQYDFEELVSTAGLSGNGYSAVLVNASGNFPQEKADMALQAYREGIPMAVYAGMYDIDMNYFNVSPADNRINGFLRNFGVSVSSGLVLDRVNQRIAVTSRSGYFTVQNIVDYPYFPAVMDIDRENVLTNGLNMLTLPYASPIRISTGSFNITVLARTSGKSWVDFKPVFISPLREYSPQPDQERGPFPVVCLVEDADTGFRLILVSSGKLIDPDFFNSAGNTGFFQNVIDWLAEDTSMISIRSKAVGERALGDIPPAEVSVIRAADIFAVPLLFIFAGLYRWKTRLVRSSNMKRRILYG